jgi:Zn-dependent peptidase ImmA (M78 family)
VLHQEIYEQIEFSTIDEWRTVLKHIPEHQRSALEFQAYDFAGLFLVPLEPLQTGLTQALKILERASHRAGAAYDVKANPDPAKPYICTWLGKHFDVSDQVIEKRLTKDHLWPPC